MPNRRGSISKYLVFILGMLILGFAEPPVQYVGLIIFFTSIIYATTEPQRKRRREDRKKARNSTGNSAHRITIISPSDWRPRWIMPIRIFPMARALVEREHSVTVLIPPIGFSKYREREYTLDGVKFRRLGLKLFDYILGGTLSILRLSTMAVSERPEIVHIFRPVGRSGATAILLKLLTNLTVIVDVDEWEGKDGLAQWDKPFWMRPVIQIVQKWAIKSADALTVGTESMRRRLSDEFKRDDIHLVTDGPAVSPSSVSQVGEVDLKQAITYLGYVHKDHHDLDILTEAGSILTQAGKKYTYRVAGSGRGLKAVRQYALEKGFDEGRFQIINTLDPNNKWTVEELLAAADVLVFPCRNNAVRSTKSASPIITYMAAGRPIVACDVAPANWHLNSDGKRAGLLVPVGKRDRAQELGQDFAAAIQMVLEDDKLAQKLVKEGKKRVKKYLWSNENRVDELEEIYFTVISNRAKRRTRQGAKLIV